MSRFATPLLLVLLGILAGGLATVTFTRPPLDETQVRAIAQDVVGQQPAGLTEANVEKIVADAVAKQPSPLTEDTVTRIAGDLIASQPEGLSEEAATRIASDLIAQQPKGVTEQVVEQIVADFIASQPKQDVPQSVAAVDPAQINPMIENYLLDNPKLLQRVSAALEAELTEERLAANRQALAELKPAIYDDPNNVVIGNPNGDVTLVELFDYNCGYCRQTVPDIATLLDEDPNLRIILKEFPILSPGSIEAAKIAVLVAETDVDYWSFHQTLFTSRGQVDKAVALKAAADLGLNPITIEMGMDTPKVAQVIQNSYSIADRLKITGTPTFIIGDEVIPGAIGVDGLRARIENMRKCGSTSCALPPG